MLTSKECVGYFRIVGSTGTRTAIDSTTTTHVLVEDLALATKQEWRTFQRPEYAAQVARYAAEALNSGKLVAVRDGIAELSRLPDASLTASSPWTSRSAYAHANCSLNGGPSQPYLDPACDLLTFDGTEAACDAATARRRVWLPQRLFL